MNIGISGYQSGIIFIIKEASGILVDDETERPEN